MYIIIPSKKKQKMWDHDYTFTDFANFYKVADYISYPLFGQYSIGVKSDNIDEILLFIRSSEKYSVLFVSIYVDATVVDYMALYNAALNIKDVVSEFELFKELTGKKKILFDNKVMYLLYSSIEHSLQAMEEALNKLVQEYGQQVLITEKMLSKIFVLNKTVYPRMVLIAYLRQDRWRRSKLERCLKELGGDIVLGAMIKNIKQLQQQKAQYYKTGNGSKLMKTLSGRNICEMYRILVIDRHRINDVTLLLELYERGINIYDSI